jgi:hypothetical protein
VNTNKNWFRSSYKLTNLNNASTPVRFRFTFNANNSAAYLRNGWAVDSFAITLPPANIDAGVEQIIQPDDYTLTGEAVEVKVKIKNYGLSVLDTIPLYYQLDNGAAVNDTFIGNLKQDSSVVFAFKKKFTSKYTYNLCAATQLSGDLNTANDKKCFRSFKDVGVYWITNPISQAFVDTSTSVKVAIKNYGIAEVDSTDITYTIDGVPKAKETWKGKLMPGDIEYYVFRKKMEAKGGTFSLCAYTTMQNDANAANNKICKSVNSTNGIKAVNSEGVTLFQNVPNPCSNTTDIYYIIPSPGKINIEVYNIYGVMVKDISAYSSAGKNRITLDVTGFSEGVYVYSFIYGNVRMTGTLIKIGE